MNKLPNYTLIGSSGHGKLASLPNDANLVAIHDHDGYTDYILPTKTYPKKKPLIGILNSSLLRINYKIRCDT